MHKTQSLKPLSSQKSNIRSKSLSNFILLNDNREITSTKHEYRPFETTERIMNRTNSLNREISFGGSYTDRKSILVTLNKDEFGKVKMNKDKSVESFDKEENVMKKEKEKFKAEKILRSKLSLPEVQQRTNKMITLLKNTGQTFGFVEQSTKEKMQSNLLRKFTDTTVEFNKKVENALTEVKVNAFRLRESTRKSVSQRKDERVDRRLPSGDVRDNKRMIGVISLSRYGLRVRLKHVVTSVCGCSKSSHQQFHVFQKNPSLMSLLSDMFSLPEQIAKPFYFFRLNKEPIASTNDLPLGENVILALMSPVWNIEAGNYESLCKEGERLAKHVQECFEEIISKKTLNSIFERVQPSSLRISLHKSPIISHYSESSPLFDHELIKDIHSYIEQIVENPELIATKPINHHRSFKSDETIQESNETLENNIPLLKQRILELYHEKFDEKTIIETGEGFRNPLLEDHSHYHLELKEKKLLGLISDHLGEYPIVKNIHMAKRETVDQLIQKAKEEKENELQEQIHPNIINRNIQSTLNSKKSLIRQLDIKHTSLFEQNIPYMMNKYGISRYEIHNLFTIYKTLEKISAMKCFPHNTKQKVLSKGIDRGTFDEGMRRLDINPGDEVIKTICYFDDFISWEHFIKIVSIGLRKTPEEKLEAILTGIGGTSNGYLNKKQISIMIGNSLMKIFDSDQVELKEYFTEVAMRDMDADNNETVDIKEIKKKCLAVANKKLENENMDLVAFLLLNS